MCPEKPPALAGGVITTIPIRTRSQAHGTRCHWSIEARKRRDQRRAVALFLGPHRAPQGPWVVKLVRVAPRALDTDNVRQALKAVRDAVTDWLGLTNDNDAKVWWLYAQGKAKTPAVVVEVEQATQAAVDELRAAEVWHG